MWWLISCTLALSSASRRSPLGSAEPSGAAPLCLQSEALLLQLRDPLADLSPPAHVLSPRSYRVAY
jgi:hypothetical protein